MKILLTLSLLITIGSQAHELNVFNKRSATAYFVVGATEFALVPGDSVTLHDISAGSSITATNWSLAVDDYLEPTGNERAKVLLAMASGTESYVVEPHAGAFESARRGATFALVLIAGSMALRMAKMLTMPMRESTD